MAKKKKYNQAEANGDKRCIHEAFESAIRFARKRSSSPNAAKIYDLTDPILRRRKAAVYNLLPEVRERFGSLYDEDGICDAWSRECCAMSHSIDGLDHLYNITLAAAIFMLDELKHSGKLPLAYRYFNQEQDDLMSLSLPDIYDPCHDEIVLRGMMELIHERDPRDNSYQAYINNVSARCVAAVEHQMPEQTAEGLSQRERFNAVMSLIHPAIKERATKRFEEKFWEFLSIYFECDAPLHKAWTNYRREADSIMDECRILQQKIEQGRKAKPEQRQAPPKCVLTPQSVLSMNELPGFDSFTLSKSESLAMDDMDRLQHMAIRGIDCEDQAEEVNRKRLALTLYSHPLQMFKYEEAVEALDSVTAQKFLDFEVNDPYETCFGYLCLIEAGGDIPWTYNAAVAVLMAAARRLPWNAYAIEQQFELEREFNEEDEEDDYPEHQHEGTGAAFAKDDTVVPLDWNGKKAELYRLDYLSKPLYEPLDAPSPNWKMNVPQLIFGLTGLVMPRTVSDSADMAESFAEAGIEEGVAKGLELYLQLAMDVQTRSKDWRCSASTPCFHMEESAAPEPETDDDAEELKAKLKQLKESNAEYREALYQAQREIETVREDAVKTEEQAASERSELAVLRELVFAQANANEIKAPHTEEAERQLPYNTKKRTVVFGGHDTWLKAIRPLLPNVTFVNRDQRPNAEMIKSADVVWIQANALSHQSFYKIINVVRTNQVPLRYFGYASAMKCAIQVLEDDA